MGFMQHSAVFFYNFFVPWFSKWKCSGKLNPELVSLIHGQKKKWDDEGADLVRHAHTHTPCISFHKLWFLGVSQRVWGLLRAGVSTSLFQTTTCMPFLGMKTTAHSGSHESNHAKQCPSVTLFPFPAFSQSWHQLLLSRKDAAAVVTRGKFNSYKSN